MTTAVDAKNLAVHGGTPVRGRLLPYARQTVEPEDIEAVARVLRSDWLTTGPEVEAFEKAVAAAVGASHAVAFSSGTAALHGAMAAAGIGAEDEVITAPLTFCATANAALYRQAKPVFADVLPDTLTLDPQAAQGRISARTKAIVPVDYAGHPAQLDELQALARSCGALLIEDACQALGAVYCKRPVGGIADMTVFSFHPVKHITTGEGGMVTTHSEEIAGRLRSFRTHGVESSPQAQQRNGPWYYEMNTLGYNYRLSDFACALGRSQLKRLPANLQRRRFIAQRYAQAFASIAAIELPHVAADVQPAWHLYPIRLRLEALQASQAEIIRALRAENIGVTVHHIPVHLHPYYRSRFGFSPGDYPVVEAAYGRLVSLPMFHGMTDADVDDVIAAVEKVIHAYSRG